MLSQRLSRTLIVIHSLFLFSLVPTGRMIESILRNNVLSSIVGKIGACVLLFIVTFYFAKLFWRRARLCNSVFPLSLYSGFLIVLGLLGYSYSVALIELAHLPLYGVLGILGWYALAHTKKPQRFLASFLLVLTIGYLDEVLQGIHPERVFDYRDIALNSYGGLLGLLILWPCVSKLRFYKVATKQTTETAKQ